MSEPIEPALVGVVVVEIACGLGAAYGGRLLSDLGADVIKVEPLDGDPWRRRRQGSMGVSGAFLSANAGKRSICVDDKSAHGRAIVDQLLGRATIVLTDSAVTVPDERFAHDPSRRRLVVSVQPDDGTHAFAAFLRTAESSVDLETKQLVEGPNLPLVLMCDIDVGATVGFAATSWLLWSQSPTPGDGPTVARAEISPREVGVSLLRQDLLRRFNRFNEPPPFATVRLVCQDGFALAHIGQGEDTRWRALVGGSGDDLPTDILAWASRLSRAEVEERCQAYDLPVGSVLTIEEALGDAQIVGRGYIPIKDGAPDSATAFLPFVEADLGRWLPTRAAPALGQHSAEVCAELGMDHIQRADLFRAGVLR